MTRVCPGLLQPSCPLTIGFGLWTLALGTHQHCPCPPPSTSTSPSIYSISSASQILILCHCPQPHRQPLPLSTINHSYREQVLSLEGREFFTYKFLCKHRNLYQNLIPIFQIYILVREQDRLLIKDD